MTDSFRNHFLLNALNEMEDKDVDFTPCSIELLNGCHIWAWTYVTKNDDVIVKDPIQLEYIDDYETEEVYTKYVPINSYSDEKIIRLNSTSVLTIGIMNQPTFEQYLSVSSNIEERRSKIQQSRRIEEQIEELEEQSNIHVFPGNRTLN